MKSIDAKVTFCGSAKYFKIFAILLQKPSNQHQSTKNQKVYERGANTFLIGPADQSWKSIILYYLAEKRNIFFFLSQTRLVHFIYSRSRKKHWTLWDSRTHEGKGNSHKWCTKDNVNQTGRHMLVMVLNPSSTKQQLKKTKWKVFDQSMRYM